MRGLIVRSPEDMDEPFDRPSAAERRHLDERLSQIATRWTVVRRASGEVSEDATEARRVVLHVYGRAAHRYLLGALKNAEAADELFQEFALRFMRGSISGGDPSRGRFRDYVKGVLFHMIAEYWRKQKKQRVLPVGEIPEAAAADAQAEEADRQFTRQWRDELLAICWNRLAELEKETGTPYHSALRCRAGHPGMPSQKLAEHLAEKCDRPFSAPAARQILRRARDQFADELLRIVVDSIAQPTADDLEHELIALDLLEHCRRALARWGRE